MVKKRSARTPTANRLKNEEKEAKSPASMIYLNNLMIVFFCVNDFK